MVALLFLGPVGLSTPAQAQDGVKERAVREAVELHDFLEDWFCGRLPKTASGFLRFDKAIAEDFVIIGPDGSLAERAAIVDAVHEDWGRWQEDAAANIEVKNSKVHEVGTSLVVVSYEEWQTTADGTVVRLSSVVFRRSSAAPLGLEWVHLHETWKPTTDE